MGMFGIGGKKPLSQSQRDQLMASIAPQIGQAQAPSIMQTAPIESGMMQAPSMGDPQKIKPHFMDKGSTSRGLLFGALGGALDGVAQYGGSQPGFANTMRQNEMLALEEKKYQRERKDSLADLITKLQTEAALKVPEQTPDAKALDWWKGLGATDRTEFLNYKDASAPIAVSGPTGTFRVSRGLQMNGMDSGSMPRPAGVSDDVLLAQAQDRLKRDPSQFNAVMEQLKAWGVGGQ